MAVKKSEQQESAMILFPFVHNSRVCLCVLDILRIINPRKEAKHKQFQQIMLKGS